MLNNKKWQQVESPTAPTFNLFWDDKTSPSFQPWVLAAIRELRFIQGEFYKTENLLWETIDESLTGI